MPVRSSFIFTPLTTLTMSWSSPLLPSKIYHPFFGQLWLVPLVGTFISIFGFFN